MNKLFFVSWLALMLAGCSLSPKVKDVEKSDTFKFVFLTDIHLKPEDGAPEGFQMAIDKVNALAPDFVITGGDLVFDVLNASYQRADSLYNLYQVMSEGFNMPVYNTMGNHEIYGYSTQPATDPGHPEYGGKMFENRIGIRFITGGAVSGLWWRTPDDGIFQEGFVLIEASEDDFSWEYVDYGWETGVTGQ